MCECSFKGSQATPILMKLCDYHKKILKTKGVKAMNNTTTESEQPAGLPEENHTPIVHIPSVREVLNDLWRSHDYFTKYNTVDKAEDAIEQLITQKQLEAVRLPQENFQKETLRTSKLAKSLFEMCRVFAADGHDGWNSKCARCQTYNEALEALKDTIYHAELTKQEGK